VDINLDRLKIDADNAPKVFVASLKAYDPVKRIIVTRHDFESGSYYQRHMIKCSLERLPTHSRLMGEGYSFSMMSVDSRNMMIDEPFGPGQALTASGTNIVTSSIASHACNPS
jgi:hypothetical protein